MNIFASFTCPYESARYLDDKRVVKMVLETTQLLSNRLIGPYKPTHTNHPCTKWLYESSENVRWLLHHYVALNHEYSYRFQKIHKCFDYLDFFISKLYDLPSDSNVLTPFPNCTQNKAKGISFKHIEDVHKAYRLYLNSRWDTDKRLPVWTSRETPVREVE